MHAASQDQAQSIVGKAHQASLQVHATAQLFNSLKHLSPSLSISPHIASTMGSARFLRLHEEINELIIKPTEMKIRHCVWQANMGEQNVIEISLSANYDQQRREEAS